MVLPLELNEQKHICLEACVETLEEAILAERNGANRLELCSRLDLDGLTPNLNLTKKIMEKISIPIKVMIRERDGNFVYSDDEILAMQNKIEVFKSIGVLEVVFGVLNVNKEIDTQATNHLAKHAFPMTVTFHKAIDQTSNIFGALEKIKSIPGISNVLTSGGKNNAESGYKIIKEMINVANNKINIIAAGSITNKNLEYLHKKIGAVNYHGRKIVGELN